MFHKENSSLYTRGKRAKDVPVRKSERKQLFGLVKEQLLFSDTATNQEKESGANIIETCFLKGGLMKRSIKLPSVMADLYLRSPQQDGDETDSWPYHLKTQCVWIQLDENRVLYDLPGLALLALLPRLSVPTAITPLQVSKFVCRGANLMRAGIFGIESASGNRVCLVSAMGNPHPYAVGLFHDQICDDPIGSIGPGKQGTGVTVVHSYGDDIWRQQVPEPSTQNGGSVDDGNYGNEGFNDGKLVVSIQRELEELDGEASDSFEEPAESSHSHSDPPTQTLDNTPDEPSPDEVLHISVCRALASLSLKKDLPMRMATFYANHVIQKRPEGTTIELKQTRYKKFGAYVAEQADNGLLTVGKDQQKDPQGMLVGFNKRHPDIEPFLEEAAKEKASTAPDGSKKLVLTDLYCIPNHFATLLRLDPDAVKGKNATSAVRRNKGALTLKEVRDILDDYMSRESLVKPEHPDQVVLDGPLTDVLFKSKKGSGDGPLPTTLTRKEVVAKWKSRLEPAFALVEVPGNKIINMGRGKPPVVAIEVSRRQSNKFVTKVLGLEKFGINPTAFSKDVAHRFACATSTETTGAASGTLVSLIQGNLAHELEALLLGQAHMTAHGGAKKSTYALPKNAVEVILRKGVPARKRNK